MIWIEYRVNGGPPQSKICEQVATASALLMQLLAHAPEDLIHIEVRRAVPVRADSIRVGDRVHIGRLGVVTVHTRMVPSTAPLQIALSVKGPEGIAALFYQPEEPVLLYAHADPGLSHFR